MWSSVTRLSLAAPSESELGQLKFLDFSDLYIIYLHCGLVILSKKIFLNSQDGIPSRCVWIQVGSTKTMGIFTDNCTFRDLCATNIWNNFQLGFQSWEWLPHHVKWCPFVFQMVGGVSCTIYWCRCHNYKCKHVKKHKCLEPLWKAANLISLGNHLLSVTDWKASILPFPPRCFSYSSNSKNYCPLRVTELHS